MHVHSTEDNEATFVKCMRKVTKYYLYHLLGVSDYYVMYRQGPSQFCETLAKITDWVRGNVKILLLHLVTFCKG